MKNSIWQEFVLEKKTIGIFAAIAGGSWLVGILGMLIFQAFIKNDKALFPIATVLLVGIGSIFLLFLLANSFAHGKNKKELSSLCGLSDFCHRAYGLCDGRHWFSYREGALRAALSWQKADGEYGALSDSGLASMLHRF